MVFRLNSEFLIEYWWDFPEQHKGYHRWFYTDSENPNYLISVFFFFNHKLHSEEHKAYRWLKAWLMIEFRMRLRVLCMCACSVTSVVSDFLQPMDCSLPQVPLFIGFSRQEYWSGLPCPPPGDLLDPGIRTQISCVFCFAGKFFTAESPWKPLSIYTAKWTPSGSWNLPFPHSFDVSDEMTLSSLQKCNFFLLLLCDRVVCICQSHLEFLLCFS